MSHEISFEVSSRELQLPILYPQQFLGPNLQLKIPNAFLLTQQK